MLVSTGFWRLFRVVRLTRQMKWMNILQRGLGGSGNAGLIGHTDVVKMMRLISDVDCCQYLSNVRMVEIL